MYYFNPIRELRDEWLGVVSIAISFAFATLIISGISYYIIWIGSEMINVYKYYDGFEDYCVETVGGDYFNGLCLDSEGNILVDIKDYE